MSRAPQPTAVAVIPARFASSRFPGKPLALIAGVPMIARVIRRARAARSLSRVCVATDDRRIARVARDEGAEAILTSRRHRTGTDRVAEAAARIRADIVVNLQGDEPLLDPGGVDRLVAALARDADCGVSTLAFPLSSDREWRRPDVVKVVTAASGRALYFSRAAVPRDRERPGSRPAGALKHIGVYAFRRDALRQFAASPPSRLEGLEGLEQLRLLEQGVGIRVVLAASDSVAVDRPEDIRRVERLLGRPAGGRRDDPGK
jgi:3-deoxy-manno-octulosonate cytidylyltransferase (CMP-KDO synthetase)